MSEELGTQEEAFTSANPQKKAEFTEMDHEPLFTDKEIAHSVANRQKNDEEVMKLQRETFEAAPEGDYDETYGGIALAGNQIRDEHMTAALKEAHDEVLAARPQAIEDFKEMLHPDAPQAEKDELLKAAMSHREDDSIDSAYKKARKNDPMYQPGTEFHDQAVARSKQMIEQKNGQKAA